ncbi:uncharacterized protein LOC121811692 [Salvia splendens]|uniref:uncharacterized protein LOC121811692 n=1 Tax=Salvia splendens TaxID=180675 RepID=UPI001C275514|nr:uncharacterized protein LOC121811692 [Salvia splendens]XP_042068528.1 uncharacterized protein LOC121811692 [Salvia splendens]
MTNASEDFKFTLKVMIDEKKKKVLFAESDCQFVDILLSFLTLPMGRIVKVLNDHFGQKAPAIGSLTNLYHSLACADNADFVSNDAKNLLLNPRSPFEVECGMLKLSLTDFQPTKYFHCGPCSFGTHSVSIYYDQADCLIHTVYGRTTTTTDEPKKVAKAAFEGVFAADRASFIISDDLRIFPSAMGIFQIASVLGIANMDKAESIDVNIGLKEILTLLKLCFISATPLADLVLNKTSLALAPEPKTLVNHTEFQEKLGSKKMVLKMVVQKSKCKLLYALAEDDFVEFLFSLLIIPLGGVGHLLAGKTCIKGIDILQRSVADLADKYFKSPSMKNRLMKPSLVHGSVFENYILPLDQQCMTRDELRKFKFSSLKFPKGQGRYLARPIAYMVMDDLTMNPLCIHSTISFLREKNIPMSDVEEVEVQVGLKEALCILKAALTSTSVLTDALLNSVLIKKREIKTGFKENSNKRVKQEV